MKFCLYANEISPHLIPFARAMVSLLGESNVRYVYGKRHGQVRSLLGWKEKEEPFIINENDTPDLAARWLLDADILLCEKRDIDLWERRAQSGKGMYYTSERWFKPIRNLFPGYIRLLNPSYFRMAYRAARRFSVYDNLVYLADGPFAAHDFLRVISFFKGDILSLFKSGKFNFEKKPCGRILRTYDKVVGKRLLNRIRIWGYYVEPSHSLSVPRTTHFTNMRGSRIKVLWVGRLLDWKRVDTLVKACMHSKNIELDIYGFGPEEHRLKKLAKGYEHSIRFHPPVAISDVRKLMREHDVYVLTSNAYEGWGAVGSEALEEGVRVLGTHEAGASATMLPIANLFHAGDWRRLKDLLAGQIADVAIGSWSAQNAAKALLEDYDQRR